MVHSEILTRETLLLRLRDQGDQVAWEEFVEIYTPLLYNYCKKRELAHADASDIVQDVMRSVSLAMENFEYDPKKGKFKGWLFTAVRNAISSHFRKKSRRPETVADTLGARVTGVGSAGRGGEALGAGLSKPADGLGTRKDQRGVCGADLECLRGHGAGAPERGGRGQGSGDVK